MGAGDVLRYLARRLDRRRAEADLDAEMRAHLEIEIEDNVRAGMAPEDARAAALQRFGNVALAKEDARAVWSLRRLQDAWRDLRHALRMARRRPGYTAAAATSLALGIGVCTAMFSVVDGVLLRALPYPDPDRIVDVRELSDRGRPMPVTEPNYLDLRARSGAFAALAEYGDDTVTVAGTDPPLRARLVWGSAELFRVYGVQPVIGRAFSADESTAGGRAVAIVSHALWQRALGGDAALARRTLRIEDVGYTVVGVMPPGFDAPAQADVWVARERLLPADRYRTAHNWSVVGRLRDGVTLEQARADASAVGRALAREHAGDTDAADLSLTPLRDAIVGKVRLPLLVLLGAVGLLLLIACANVGNLMLAQATARHRELAVRAALGATRLRLAQQFICEGLVLAVLGAAVGVPLAFVAVDLFIGANRGILPRVETLAVDPSALMFALAACVLVAVGLGLATTLRATDLHAASRERTPKGARLRDGLVVVQVALTFTLLVGAGLLARSFGRLLDVDPGFRPERALALDVALTTPTERAAQARARQLQRDMLDRLGALPGVTAAGAASSLPLRGGAANGTFLIDNDMTRTGDADYIVASPGYFAAMGIPLVRGRVLADGDTPDAAHTAVISESVARRYFPGVDPIGQRIQFGNMDGDPHILNVVGVVGDVRQRGLDAAARPTIYACVFQRPLRSALSFVVRGAGDAGALAAAMRAEVRALDPELPIELGTLEQIFSSSLAGRRFSLVLLAVFAALALLLAVTGVYGVIATSVAQRRHEIGIRVALGARPRAVLGMVLGHGAALAGLGVALGAAGALAVTRLIAGLLYGVGATDPTTFALVAPALVGLALLACVVPARRALRVDPMVALREE